MSTCENSILHTSKKYHRQLVKFCQPLLTHFEIDHFWHAYVGDNGDWSHLNNKIDIVEEFIVEGYYLDSPYVRHSSCLDEGISPMAEIEDNEFKTERDLWVKKYHSHLILNFSWKTPEGMEHIGFGSYLSHQQLYHKIANEISSLKYYFNQFRKENQSIFCELAECRVNLINLLGEEFYKPKCVVVPKFCNRKAFFDEIGVKMHKPLSAQEIFVLKLMGQGCSAREIADSMVLSVRTIEHYIENIKNKCGCFTKRELVERSKLFCSL